MKCVEGERADVTVALVGDSTFETLYLDAFQNPSLARHDGLGPTYDGRLHHLLRRELAEKADAVGTVNFAVTGSTSRSALRSGQWGECMSARPDVVLINFGINDQGAGIGTEEYRSNLRTMVRQARRAGMRPVLVGFMWWDYPAHTLVDWNTLLSPYASVIAEVAREDDVLLIDPAPRFREALRQGRWDLWGHNDETYLSAWEDGSEPGTRRHHTNVHEWIPGAQLLAETVADGLVSSGILSGMTPDGVDRTPSRR